MGLDKKYDPAWGVTERLESLERATKDLLRYIQKTNKDLREALREADAEDEEQQRRVR